MRAQEVTFLHLVQGEKQFQVPLYQRTYSWQEQHLEQLWRDITDQAESLALQQSRPPHFLGSVVLAPGSVQAGGLSKWLVVDGQQRLTTLMIALCALRDHLLETGAPDAARRVTKRYLINEFYDGLDHYRLLPTQADRATFLAAIGGAPGADAADGIGAAYRSFRARFLKADDPEDDQDLERIETVIRDRLSLVEITAEHGDNVYRIFESINNTGLTLSQADLLRNYVFMLLPTRGEAVYQTLWLPMQELLGADNLELLVWLDLVIRGNYRVKQSEIYRAQQDRLDQLGGDETAIEHEVAALARRAQLLALIVSPDREQESTLRTRLTRLGSWGAQTAYPLVMHLLDLRAAGRATTAEVVEALTCVESYLVRRMICQVPTNNLNRVLNSAPAELPDDLPIAQAVRLYLSSRRRRWPSDPELRDAIRTRPFYWTGRGPQRTFVLRALEESYGSDEPVDFSTGKLTVEHVMPQSATKEWLDQLAPVGTGEAQDPQELHDLLVHTLGNLTLTGHNSELSNSPLQRKQQIYSTSALAMNREIADAQRWGQAEILARADQLADRAAKIWPAPVAFATEDIGGGTSDWDLMRRALAALPRGSWTTYGDVAELIGSSPVAVGVRCSRDKTMISAWRVLAADGKLSSQFSWNTSGRTDDPHAVLTEEGVRFGADGRADQVQRMSAEDLALLLGLEVPDVEPAITTDADRGERRFYSQLKSHQPAPVAAAVQELLVHWNAFGGELEFGAAHQRTCFLTLARPNAQPRWIWPLAIYPAAGTAEVVFQHLRRRPPFDAVPVREQLRLRFNESPGIDLPASKISLRPSFPLEVLVDPVGVSAVLAALEWFVQVVASQNRREVEQRL